MNVTRSIRAWLAVDVVLVTVLLVLVVVVTSGGSPSTPSVAATSPTAGPASPAASGVEPVRLRLPSGNIACVVSVNGAKCTIASITYDPPAVPGCTGRTGHVAVLTQRYVGFVCEHGRAPRVSTPSPDVQTLSYGGSVTVGEYTCSSATNGATCVDDSGRGFRLA
ncbi:MAG: hypothetical protein AAGC49_12930, partial [Brevundimonas sp.]